MKKRHIFLMALVTLFFVSCTEYDAPSSPEAGKTHYGNPAIEPTNVITIADLKTLYSNAIENNGLQEVTQPTQIQGMVVGNDIGGNIYQSIYVQDETGGIQISISQSGLYGAFSVGQCVLIDLKRLYVGGYGKQAQIGTTYVDPTKDTPSPQIGRMSRYLWRLHYKLISPIDNLKAIPEVKSVNDFDFEKDCGKLVTLQNVVLSEADGTAVFAPTDGSVSLTSNCANRNIKGATNIVVRTSTYADFAKEPMPTGKVNITGIATRYNDTWQILMRTITDIQPYTGGNDDPDEIVPAGKGTKDDPFNIAAAIEKCKEIGTTESPEKYYVKGIVVTGGEADSQFGNVTFDMADVAKGANRFKAFQVYGSDGNKLPAGYKVNVGDVVVIYGPIYNYKDNTPETAGKGAAYIVSINGKKTDGGGGGSDDQPTPSTTIGTADAPITVAEALTRINALADGAKTTQDAYVKGKIVAITEINTSYGNATYTISDNGQAGNVLTVYRGLYLNQQKFSSTDALKVGDNVVVVGKLQKYVKNGDVTPEMAQGNYLISIDSNN